MNEWLTERAWAGDSDEIEAAVLAAAGYVRASDDLRPRVLDAARLERSERRGRRMVRFAAIGFVLLAMLSIGLYRHFDAAVSLRQSLVAVSADAIFVRAQSVVAPGGDLAWGVVESVADLRRRQADAISMAP
jgi:hypothetical protein